VVNAARRIRKDNKAVLRVGVDDVLVHFSEGNSDMVLSKRGGSKLMKIAMADD
jgi:hypothetical protein